LAQANAAGSVPWHFYSPASGQYLTATANPKLWVDYRGGLYGTVGLTQPVPSSKLTGWTPDPAHQPDLDYVAYLMTGDRTYLDELNAQASYDVLAASPANRQGALGIVADGNAQVRDQAWSLRAIVEAAAANPSGSAEKAYFTQIENNNFSYLLHYVGTLNEGEAAGWLTGSYGNAGQIAPWQQFFFATTVTLAAQQGVPAAAQLLGWEANFLAGMFINAAKGFSPFLGGAYNISTYATGKTEAGGALQTWAGIAKTTLSSGFVAATAATDVASAQYAMEARGALADLITVTQDARAIQAYGWVSAFETTANLANEQAWPVFDIAPRLSDGQLLTGNNVIVAADTVARVIQGSATADQLIYKTGAGNVTLQGGSGINVLFAGSGTDTLMGGANNDYLFAGSGTDLLAAGAGRNYMQAGSGADTFLLDARQAASDTIAGFTPDIDKLSVLNAAGNAASASEVAGYISGATADASGNAVLHLSSGHAVTLQGIAKAQLSAAWFGGQSILPPAPTSSPPPGSAGNRSCLPRLPTRRPRRLPSTWWTAASPGRTSSPASAPGWTDSS
jgi:Ca2+-binding RTX toxin-like protein